jgi:hypothetical protein
VSLDSAQLTDPLAAGDSSEDHTSEEEVPPQDEGAVGEPTRAGRRARRAEIKASARRVHRVIRRVHPWSVLKVSFLFFLCFYGVVVLASLLLWRAAVGSGSVDNVEEFIVDLGFNDFQFHPDTMFQSVVTGGAIMVVVATFFAVLTCLVFNLIADVTGGIRVTMIEQRVPGRTTVDDLD